MCANSSREMVAGRSQGDAVGHDHERRREMAGYSLDGQARLGGRPQGHGRFGNRDAGSPPRIARSSPSTDARSI